MRDSVLVEIHNNFVYNGDTMGRLSQKITSFTMKDALLMETQRGETVTSNSRPISFTTRDHVVAET